ncbi:unnamed protein product [Notodromas monacha]|uniref:Kringle domain-containing protein n=1 Tax=Notodromas monacha TaxID=399045 RepID=A0A7R9BGI0_9CRUS|nr:unnamed protein product [Notodromas monacha]CAG0914324.1 unnamed protein product [Notodromas monacha]
MEKPQQSDPCVDLSSQEPLHLIPLCSRTAADCREGCFRSVSATCTRGRGRFYQGTENVTEDGIPCQRWDSQTPHTHNQPPLFFPELQDAENYCRNAGGQEPSPWCYTTDPAIRWQRCNIPQCVGVSRTDHVDVDSSERNEPRIVCLIWDSFVSFVVVVVVVVADDDDDDVARPISFPRVLLLFPAAHHEVSGLQNETIPTPETEIRPSGENGDGSFFLNPTAHPTYLAAVASVGVVAVLLVFLVMFLFCRLCKRRKQGYTAASTQDVDIDVDKLPSNYAYHKTGIQLNPKLERLEYPRNDIIYIRDVGEGAFGKVFQIYVPPAAAGVARSASMIRVHNNPVCQCPNQHNAPEVEVVAGGSVTSPVVESSSGPVDCV